MSKQFKEGDQVTVVSSDHPQEYQVGDVVTILGLASHYDYRIQGVRLETTSCIWECNIEPYVPTLCPPCPLCVKHKVKKQLKKAEKKVLKLKSKLKGLA